MWPDLREERYFDREEVLGRDVTSVFSKPAPRKAAVHDSDGSRGPSSTPLADAEALKQSLGARRFISETEVRVDLLCKAHFVMIRVGFIVNLSALKIFTPGGLGSQGTLLRLHLPSSDAREQALPVRHTEGL